MTLDLELQATFFDMKQVANICKIKKNGKIIGRNELFKLLRKNRILQEGNNLPFKKYIDAGYFEIKKKVVKNPNQYNRDSFKTTVSQSGIAFIKELFKENI